MLNIHSNLITIPAMFRTFVIAATHMRFNTFIIGLLCLLGAAHGETIPLFAAAGVKAPAQDIIAAFEQRTGHSVTRVYDTAGAAEERFVAAGKGGLLITTEVRILKSSVGEPGALRDGMPRRVGDTLAGVAMSPSFATAQPAMAMPSAIDTPQGLKSVLLAARRIAFSDPARGATVGTHFINIIDKLGIRQEVLAKAITAKDGIETMRLVANGEVDLGITQVSEIVQSNPKLLLGSFPLELDLATRYNSWHASGASTAVKALADAFSSEAGRASLARNGLRLPE